MRAKTRHKGAFKAKLDRKAIDLLLNLRRCGWSYDSLSSFFGVSDKAIKYQCLKYGVHYEGYGIQLPTIREERWKNIDVEKINVGKSYAEYLREYKNRFPSKKRI